jgi:MFS transporter, SP family, general alpha glucoside:H+ symporter
MDHSLDTKLAPVPSTVDDGKPTAGDAEVLAEAIAQENSLSFVDAVKLYPAAVGWSAFVSIGVIMLAFDPQLLGNLYAMPQFTKDFGYEYNGEVCDPAINAYFNPIRKPILTSRVTHV